MSIENIEDLEEALDELFPNGFSIDVDSHGQLIVHTRLQQDENGELNPLDLEEDEEIDPDLEPLEDDESDEL